MGSLIQALAPSHHHMGTPSPPQPAETCSLWDPIRTCWYAGGYPSTERPSCFFFQILQHCELATLKEIYPKSSHPCCLSSSDTVNCKKFWVIASFVIVITASYDTALRVCVHCFHHVMLPVAPEGAQDVYFHHMPSRSTSDLRCRFTAAVVISKILIINQLNWSTCWIIIRWRLYGGEAGFKMLHLTHSKSNPPWTDLNRRIVVRAYCFRQCR